MRHGKRLAGTSRESRRAWVAIEPCVAAVPRDKQDAADPTTPVQKVKKVETVETVPSA